MNNREIKFRVWDKSKKSFLKNKGSFDFNWLTGEESSQEFFIIQQYTGLKDKNGREIYEGDIVKYISYPDNAWRDEYTSYEGKGIVKFENGQFFPRYIKYDCEDPFYSYETKDLDIIGNIFENPELIKI